MEYLESVYRQVGVILPENVVRRYGEVEKFHESVVRNRRLYLDSERSNLINEIASGKEELEFLDSKRSKLMMLLASGGALETYNELQRELGGISGRLSELQERRTVVDRWENSNRHLQLKSAELELKFSNDLIDRREHIRSIAETYSKFAYRLYGSRRPASLSIEPTKFGYKFTPFIGGDASEGVRSMAMFCFDLTMSVHAWRAGKGPDFLVHDSHLYDGVEGRQLANALELASDVAESENMQYVVCLNSDDMNKAVADGFSARYHQAAKMTDAYENGGLFGVRFN
jgi:uncharacterized protein YydD (DUF2326 family)